jgi:hypothetical protein
MFTYCNNSKMYLYNTLVYVFYVHLWFMHEELKYFKYSFYPCSYPLVKLLINLKCDSLLSIILISNSKDDYSPAELCNDGEGVKKLVHAYTCFVNFTHLLIVFIFIISNDATSFYQIDAYQSHYVCQDKCTKEHNNISPCLD